MRTFAQKPAVLQKSTSTKTTIPGQTRFGQGHKAGSALHLQAAIRNQAVQRLLQSKADELGTWSPTVASTRFAHDFTRIQVHPASPIQIQTKLRVDTLGDSYEQEADRVSEQVMRMPEPQLPCACGGGCPRCGMERPGKVQKRLQTKHIQGWRYGPEYCSTTHRS